MAHRIAHFADKAHLDKDTLARVNSVIMVVVIGGGLALCAIGAFVYDMGRMVSAW
jgi:hypothetical protein